VPLTWEKAGQSQSGIAIAKQQIEVSVFGESVILAALGVPTFLFLPGFLMLSTFALLRKLGKPKSERDDSSLKANTPDFYLLTITLSILSYVAYPLITERFGGIRRDLTEAYGLADVVGVWLGSLALGVLAFGGFRLILLIGKAIEHFQRLHKERHEFGLRDKELQFLWKLGRKKLGLKLVQVSIPSSKTTEKVFLICDVPFEQGKSWVAPKIMMNWGPGTEKEQEALFHAIDKNDAAQTAKLLARAEKVSLRWEPSGSVSKLQTVETSSIDQPGEKQLILENA
jgi:hypothetical protein